MARFRNDFDDGVEQYVDDATGKVLERPAVRVLPSLGYTGVRRGQEFEVPDEEWDHWAAGGFTPLTPNPRPQPEEAAAPAAPAAAAAPTLPPRAATPAPAPAPEGTEAA